MSLNKKIKTLVVDSGAFFKNVPLWEFAEEFYCVDDVIQEIRDKQAKQFINSLPIQLIFKEPSPSSIKFINDFTKKTGDFASLSLADVKVLALTYQLEVESKGSSSHLKTEPASQRVKQIASKKPPNAISDQLEGFYLSSNKSRKSNEDANSADMSDTTVIQVVENEEKNNIEVDYLISIHDFYKLEYHLALFPYVKEYVISARDIILFWQLKLQFSLLKTLYTLAQDHNSNGCLDLFIRICQNFDLEFPKLKSIGEQTLFLESESQKVSKKFCEIFCKFPHFKRWFCHMMTYSEEELKNIKNISGDTENILLQEIFDALSDKSANETTNSCETSDIVTDKLNELQVEDVNNGNVEFDDHCVPSSVDSVEKDELKRDEEDIEIAVSEVLGCMEENYEIIETNEENSEEFEEEEDDDDDGGWITPSNIKSLNKKKQAENEEDIKGVEVACITGDFSMQNTLKHIGLNVLGVDGKLIKTVRTYILRCHACFKTTNRMEKIFCPHCGYKTLKRVSVTLNPDGTQQIWISTRRNINIRGMKFSLPAPKGGKHAVNPILVEDQREAQMRVGKLGRMKNDPMHEDYGARAGGSPFITRDVYSRAAQLGIKSGKTNHRGVYYWELKNPNVPMKKGNTKRKR